MVQLLMRIWQAVTAFGKPFCLGAAEAWGFWNASILFLLVILFAATVLNGLFWRFIEGRLRPRMRDREAEAKLRQEIRRLKEARYDDFETIAQQQAEMARLHGQLAEVRGIGRLVAQQDRQEIAAGAQR